MIKPYKLAFIGGGINSVIGSVHFSASRMDNKFVPVSGCFSRNAEINRQTAERWGIEDNRLYSDWVSLLDNEINSVDAVVILTPTPTHAEITLEALKRGYAVICEKSIAMNVQEAMPIATHLKKNDGFLSVVYNYTGYPIVKEMKHIISSNKLGKINQIHIEMPQDIYTRLNTNKIQSWRNIDGIMPTISLDLGIHLHHMVSYLVDQKATSVIGEEFTNGNNPNITDNVICIAKYANQLRCQMWFGKTAAGIRNGLKIRVFGEIGSMEWLQTNPEELVLNYSKGERMILDRANTEVHICSDTRYNRFKAGHPIGFLEAFSNWYSDVHNELENHKNGIKQPDDYVYGINRAINGLKFFESVTESSKKRCWINIPEQGKFNER